MRTRLPLLLSTLGAVGLSVFSGTSQAQESAKDGQFSVQRFEPAPGSGNYLSVEGARVDGEWGVTAENRRARYYRLTAAGRKQLSAELDQFDRVMTAIRLVIQPS